MFISREEADARKNSTENFLSPNYIPPTLDPWDGGLSPQPFPVSSPDKPKNLPDTSSSVPEPSSSNNDDVGPTHDVMARSTIDALLKGTVDPYGEKKSNGTLRGQIDTQIAVGTTGVLLGPTASSHLFGLSKEQVRAYQNGMGSTAEYTDEPHNKTRSERMKTVKDTLAEMAAGRLESALVALTDDKIEKEKYATGIARVAKDMAIIIDKVTKNDVEEQGIHFHIFRPEMKTVAQYNTVHLTAPEEKPQTEGRLD